MTLRPDPVPAESEPLASVNDGQPPDCSHIHLPLRRYRRLCLFMGILLFVSWGAGGALYTSFRMKEKYGLKSASLMQLPGEEVNSCRLGPWGKLEFVRIATEMPLNSFSMSQTNMQPPRWIFKNKNASQLAEFFQAAGTTADQLASLLNQQRWEIKPGEISVNPVEDIVLGLSPSARRKIYAELEQFAENPTQRGPYTFDESALENQLSESFLSGSAKSLFTNMLYPHGPGKLCFADSFTALNRLHNDEERKLFIKMISYCETYMIKLVITPDSDVDSLIRYWGVGGRAGDIGTLLRSAKRVKGGCSLDITNLLPAIVRQRINTYPSMSTNVSYKYPNCSWTALNFFREIPDDSFRDFDRIERELTDNYQPIPAPSELGDLIIFLEKNGGENSDKRSLFHIAIYIADDFVFTKNGVCFTQPWIFQKLADMIECYIQHGQPDRGLEVIYARRKGRAGL